MVCYTGSFALAAKDTGIGIVYHYAFGYPVFFYNIFMRYRAHGAYFLASEAPEALFLVELRLPPEIGVRDVRNLRELGCVRPLYERRYGF